MPKLEIQTGEDNPILRKKSVAIRKFDAGLKKFAKEMRKAMLKKDGLGLAAPQVGVNERMVVVTIGYKTNNAIVTVMVNPVITEFSDETCVEEEGCLSLPGIYKKVERPRGVTVKFFDVDGGEQTLRLKDLDARVVQHEVDHLDGVLFVDRV